MMLCGYGFDRTPLSGTLMKKNIISLSNTWVVEKNLKKVRSIDGKVGFRQVAILGEKTFVDNNAGREFL